MRKLENTTITTEVDRKTRDDFKKHCAGKYISMGAMLRKLIHELLKKGRKE